MQKDFTFSYQEYSHFTDLPSEWANLVTMAQQAVSSAYAPYSKFLVGAAILDNLGHHYLGSNQENASYSLTICAERTALGNYAMRSDKSTHIAALAVTYFADDVDIKSILAPCGACRQHILEYQSQQEFPFPIIFTAINGGTIVVPSILSLLPFTFSKEALPKNNS